MIRAPFLSAVMILFSICTAAAADQPHLEFEGLYWLPSLEASARSSTRSLRGSDIDLERTVGLGDTDFPIGRFTWHTGPYSRIFLEYMEGTFDGGRTLEREINFAGRTFQVGTGIKGDLDIQFGRLGWVWQFIHFAHDRVRLGTVLEVRLARAEFSLTGQVNDRITKASEEITVPLPAAGLALDLFPLDWLQIFLQGSGIPDTEYGFFLTAEGGVKVIPLRNLSFSVGYRYENFRIEDSEDNVELKFSGPFAGVSLRF